MKTKTITIIAAILLCFANTADATIPATSLHFAPKPLKKVTITFAVEANCGDCKNRIEPQKIARNPIAQYGCYGWT